MELAYSPAGVGCKDEVLGHEDVHPEALAGVSPPASRDTSPRPARPPLSPFRRLRALDDTFLKYVTRMACEPANPSLASISLISSQRDPSCLNSRTHGAISSKASVVLIQSHLAGGNVANFSIRAAIASPRSRSMVDKYTRSRVYKDNLRWEWASPGGSLLEGGCSSPAAS